MNRLRTALLLLIFSTPSWGVEKITIAVRDDFSLSPLYVEILQEAYSRIGQPIDFAYLPGGSSLKHSNSGELDIDGEAGRLSGALKRYPNLVKVPIPIFYSELTAFSNNKELKIKDWKDLKNYDVTTRIGYKVVINRLNGIRHKAVETSDIALTLVEKNRADVAILTKDDGIRAINTLKLKNVFQIQPPIQTLPVFHMLHKRYNEIIPKLELALKDMAQEGLLLKLWNKHTSTIEH